MKYVLITHNANNLGDVAILEATIQHIHSIDSAPAIVLESNNVAQSEKQFPTIDVGERLFPTKNIKHAEKTISFSFIGKNLPFLYQVIKRSLASIWCAYNPKSSSRYEILQHIKTADTVLSIAGDSIAPQYAWYLRFFELWLLSKLKKKVILYAQSIGPFEGYQRKLAKHYLSKATLILARDQRTYDLLHEYGVHTQIERTADTVISLQPQANSNTERAIKKYQITEKTVGIVIRTDLYSGIQKDKYQEYLDGMAQVVKHIIDKGYEPLFISTIAEDTEAAKQFAKNNDLSIETFDLREYLPSEVKTILSKFSLVISPRMHPIILSSTMGTPVIGLGKEFKMVNYLQLIGLGEQFVPMIPLSPKILATLIDSTLEHQNKIRTDIHKALPCVVEKSQANAQYLKRALS
jgi:colanic acid/amylovoran biosynthesis protein